MSLSNNPPDVVLNLSMKEAEFLLRNCNSNIRLGLQLIQETKNRETAEKLVEFNEQFKAIREKLLREGVKSDG